MHWLLPCCFHLASVPIYCLRRLWLRCWHGFLAFTGGVISFRKRRRSSNAYCFQFEGRFSRNQSRSCSESRLFRSIASIRRFPCGFQSRTRRKVGSDKTSADSCSLRDFFLGPSCLQHFAEFFLLLGADDPPASASCQYAPPDHISVSCVGPHADDFRCAIDGPPFGDEADQQGRFIMQKRLNSLLSPKSIRGLRPCMNGREFF